jgi:hypothetical protein
MLASAPTGITFACKTTIECVTLILILFLAELASILTVSEERKILSNHTILLSDSAAAAFEAAKAAIPKSQQQQQNHHPLSFLFLGLRTDTLGKGSCIHCSVSRERQTRMYMNEKVCVSE